MSEGIRIAQIADIQKGHSILKELQAQGIAAELRDRPDIRAYEIVIFDEKQHDRAVEIFCLLMGIAYPKQNDIPQEWQAMKSLDMGPVTIVVLIGCIALFLFWKLAGMEHLYELLLFSRFKKTALAPELQAGQWWRLITPSFLHFGWMHIIFNMLWWKDLGAVVEKTKGSTYLIFFILVVSIISHPFQYLVTGPLFGGLSGVVYGLLGHLWMKRLFDKDFPYGLPRPDVMMMIAWFFLGLFNLFDMRMANMVHAIGLSVGMLSVLIAPSSWAQMKLNFKNSVLCVLFALGLPVLSLFVEILHS